jgi:hypothetical protein
MAEFSSITRTGKHEPFGLHVKRGYVQGHEHVHKFGFNTSVTTSATLIWNGGGDYTYPTSAAQLGVVGTSTTDNSQITIQGVDGDYNEVSNIVTLNGTTTVTTSASYLRAYRAFVSDDNEPAGDVTIRHSGDVVAIISEDEGQTLMATYTVPAGYTAYLYQLVFGGAAEVANKYMTIRLKVREQGGIFRTQAKYTTAAQTFEETMIFPLVFPEKTDVEITAQSSSQVQQASAMFDLLLIKNVSV